jgi:hypothetical protein
MRHSQKSLATDRISGKRKFGKRGPKVRQHHVYTRGLKAPEENSLFKKAMAFNPEFPAFNFFE